MTHLRKPRFWLLTTAALIFGSHMSASAQSSTVYQPGSYNTGAPTMVAAAPSLPNITADQIARDVTAEFNPRTGQAELIAAPFDPFEDDPNLAGSLRLRSASGAVAIDGQPLQNGALVEIDFYYNSPSDDPYGGRNYSDAAFVTGELAPAVVRDTRILECSTRANDVVYDHLTYYNSAEHYNPYASPSRHGIYQPYRHYTGHSSFGFGFGPARRNRGHAGAFLPRAHLPNAGRRVRGTRGGRRNFTGGRRGGADTRADTPVTPTAVPTVSTTNLTATEIQQRVGGLRSTATDLRNGGRLGPRRSITATPRIRIGPAPATPRTRTQTTQPNNPPSVTATGRPESAANAVLSSRTRVRTTSRSDASRQSIPKQSAPARSTPKIPASRPVIPKQSSPKRSSSSSSSSRSTTSSRSSFKRPSRSSRRSTSRPSQPTRRRSPSSTRRKLNFFPDDGYGGRSVVSSRSVDCAREDTLRVFIPNDRLDAARFDGLTLIALDAQGGETPIYIPPNYIQGYRLAETGRVQPQGFSSAPQSQFQSQPQPQSQSRPQVQTQPQRPLIEAAPCPTGTVKQPDGTCLQTTQSGYP